MQLYPTSVLGVNLNPHRILKHAMQDLGDEDLINETITLLAEHLPQSALAGITAQIEAIISSDDMSSEEEGFLNDLIQAWQVEDQAK